MHRVKICIPSAGDPVPGFKTCLKTFEGHSNFEFTIDLQVGPNLDRMRNVMFQDRNFDAYLCIDDDCMVTFTDFKKMWDRNTQVISGAVPYKSGRRLIAGNFLEGYPGCAPDELRLSGDARGYYEVDWTGFGCLLVRKSALREENYPYVRRAVVKAPPDYGHKFEALSEDVGMFVWLKESTGLKPWIDCEVRIRHVLRPHQDPDQIAISLPKSEVPTLLAAIQKLSPAEASIMLNLLRDQLKPY